jgi:calcium/calmodulin-dependent protein kinase I
MVDMWSAGCILYTMLSGQLPFNSEWLNDLVVKISKGEFEMTGEVWANISDEAKDLISKMLQVDPSKRITPEQALKHEWIS